MLGVGSMLSILMFGCKPRGLDKILYETCVIFQNFRYFWSNNNLYILVFKGKIIDRSALIRSTQMSAWNGILFLIFSVLFYATENIVFAVLTQLGFVVGIFLFRAKVRAIKRSIGYLEMDTFHIRIFSEDHAPVREIPMSEVTNLVFENISPYTNHKWNHALLVLLGTMKHPMVRFEYQGVEHKYYFAIDSFYMEQQLKSIQESIMEASMVSELE